MKTSIDPILRDFPMPIQTERLLLRPVEPGDGKAIFAAVEESRESLSRGVTWSKYVKTWEDSERYARESYANFILRKSMVLGVFLEGTFIGTCGFNYFLWNIPSAEIGYWCRSLYQNKGYIKEATKAIAEYGFNTLNLERVVISCLDENQASRAVAEGAGFALEVRAPGLVENLQGDGICMGRRYVRFRD
jgi:ribosomal-protein-serine acetyltransferase